MNVNHVRIFAIGAMATLGSVAVLAQTPSASDKMFLHKASEGGYAEVQLGQLAAQKASSDDVKKFGQKMVDDHTALNDQMKPFAEAAGLQPPTKLSSKDQAEYDKLNGLSGDAFDKEYLAYSAERPSHGPPRVQEGRNNDAGCEFEGCREQVARQ